LRGKGRVGSNGVQGDLIICYHVQLPTGLTEHQKSLLREMQQG
jgi:curved DNA-binding protein